MESKSDPTFAEALLSLVIAERTWYHGCPISTAWWDRAQKAEAQVAEVRDAFTLAVGERDSLRAELDKAKADVMAANLRARTAQDERDSLAAKLREAQDAAQSYWLIELSPSCYLTAAGCLIPKFTWTAEYDSALKFQSKTEADQVLTAIRNLVPSLFPENLPTCARPTEHAWIAARKALDAKEQP